MAIVSFIEDVLFIMTQQSLARYLGLCRNILHELIETIKFP